MTEKSPADRVLELEQNYEWFIPTEYITRPILDSEQMDELAALAPALARQVKALEDENREIHGKLSDAWTWDVIYRVRFKEMRAELERKNEEINTLMTSPPCRECGAMTSEEAETKCICSGDKDDCHGCQIWAD